LHASLSGPGRRGIADRNESWIGDSLTGGMARLVEGSAVGPLPGRLKPREVSIERASHPNRFQSQWLISAYEKIAPSSSRPANPSTVPIGSENIKHNNMREHK